MFEDPHHVRGPVGIPALRIEPGQTVAVVIASEPMAVYVRADKAPPRAPTPDDDWYTLTEEILVSDPEDGSLRVWYCEGAARLTAYRAACRARWAGRRELGRWPRVGDRVVIRRGQGRGEWQIGFPADRGTHAEP